MKHILFSLLLFFIATTLTAQQLPVNPATVDVGSLSDAQIQRIISEMQSRGLTQDQAIAMAKAQGASQTQIDQLTTRIQQLQAGGGIIPGTTPDKGTETFQPKQTSKKKEIAVSEKTKKIFGYQLFNSDKLTFEPDVNIPIPQNYTLGIGDQITINVWGASQQKYQLTIDKSGTINIPDVGPVNLRGISFETGKSLIKSRLMDIYNGMTGQSPNTWAEVTLSGGRSIKISVIGEINAPGTYTLPATATAFNALYLSGGPNENGSFREIRLIRDGATIKIIDVYDFLINADPTANVQLREQDILFVPNYKTRVEIAGEVKQKGYFEIKENEKLTNLLKFAGGLSDKAYSRSLTILRNNDKEREVRNVAAANFATYALQNGDFVKVDSILNRFSNRVSITGAVFHPGNFELTPGMKLSDLIKKSDGLKEEAFMNRALISRRKTDNTMENISFDPKQVLNGSFDPELQKEDVVQIQSIFDLRESQTIIISGEVNKPATFEYIDSLTLGDLIFKAGGFNESADPTGIEIVRKLNYEEAAKVSNKLNEVIKFSLTRELKLAPSDAAFKLKPFDEVFVRRAPGNIISGTFTISGEVAFTGTYAITNKQERVSDAINRAGGLIPEAYLPGATLTRTINLTPAEIAAKKALIKKDTTINLAFIADTESNQVGINFVKIMANPGSSIDLLLQPGDVIHIPKLLQTVTVSGNVMNPISMTYEKNLSVKNYIGMAGGYGERSRKSRTYVIYPNGTTATTKRFIFRVNPKIMPGSEIIVPKKPERKDDVMKWVSIGSALSSLAVSIIMVKNILNL
ncbi:MAG: SLBB domain-containing protein [Prolixibacteraceae bacterium]